MRKIIGSITLIPFFVILTMVVQPVATQAAGDFNVQEAISKGDHKGLAAYYKEKAEKYRKRAAKHETMEADYKKSHVHYKGMENTMAIHCKALKAKALEAATQYEEMAKAEEKLAAQ